MSLWLNCIHEDGHVTWFGYQLARGNSLGAYAGRCIRPSAHPPTADPHSPWAGTTSATFRMVL